MSFLEIQFPADLSRNAEGGPAFATSIVTLQNGHEQRNSNWGNARARYNIATGVQTTDQLQALLAFFRVVRGRALGFRYKDWSDYQGVGEVIGTGDGSSTVFQLVKNYSVGANIVTRTITKPVAGSISIYKNSVLQTTGVSVNTTTGLATFTTPPASGVSISADFAFDVPVRFDTDYCNLTLESLQSGKWGDIPLVEIR